MSLRMRKATVPSATAEEGPGRSRRRRIASLLAVTAMLSSGLVLGSTSPASAAGCKLKVICGRVNNYSDFGLYNTVALNADNSPNRCAVWNSKGGATRSEVNWGCTQRYLAPGDSRGGNFTGDDVDAFTFNDRPYYLSIGGQWLLIQQGVWTKISDVETATCYPYLSSAAQCYVETTG